MISPAGSRAFADAAGALAWRGVGLTGATRAPYVPAVPTFTSITLKDMRFHVLVGILPHEEAYAQPLELDVTVWLDGARGEAGATLDYRDLYAAVSTTVTASPVRYLEELVEQAARSVLALAPVVRVRVAARKPNVALPGPLAYAEVALERDRNA